MADQLPTQEQDAQKREHATIPEHRTVQAEEEQYPVYLDIKRNWHARQLPADKEECDFFGFTGNKVFFMKDGRIGMEVSGRVFVASIELWASLALAQEQDE
jgi:hypothetical protein